MATHTHSLLLVCYPDMLLLHRTVLLGQEGPQTKHDSLDRSHLRTRSRAKAGTTCTAAGTAPAIVSVVAQQMYTAPLFQTSSA